MASEQRERPYSIDRVQWKDILNIMHNISNDILKWDRDTYITIRDLVKKMPNMGVEFQIKQDDFGDAIALMFYIVYTLRNEYNINIFHAHEFELYPNTDINIYKIIEIDDTPYQLVSFIKSERCFAERTPNAQHFVSFAHNGGDDWVYFNACKKPLTQYITKEQINNLPNKCKNDKFNIVLGLYVDMNFIKKEFHNYQQIDDKPEQNVYKPEQNVYKPEQSVIPRRGQKHPRDIELS